MKELLPPSPTPGGGSGAGWSYWKSRLGCAKRYTLGQQRTFNPEYFSPAQTGTYYHYIMEKYHSGELDNCLYTFPTEQNPSWAEAVRLFNAYLKEQIDINFYGTVLGCEVPIESDHPDTVGVLPFTGRVDMVVEVDEAAASRIWKKFETVVVPGTYLFDTKTKGRESSRAQQEFQDEEQFSLYQRVWNTTRNRQCRGLLVLGVYRTKVPKFRLYNILPPSDDMMDRCQATLKKAKLYQDTFGDHNVNTVHCYDYHKPCPYMEDGSCPRR